MKRKWVRWLLALGLSCAALGFVSCGKDKEENGNGGNPPAIETPDEDEKTPSKGLSYTLIDDGKAYEVSGMGECTDTEIIIPETYEGLPVTTIGKHAFYRRQSLISITIPDSITTIEYNAFQLCEKLTSVTIGKGVECIETPAVKLCDNLANITIKAGNPVYHSDGNCIIETASKTLIMGCKASVIPSDGSVTAIGEDAFYCCDKLTSIVIPDSVTSIGDDAFYACDKLKYVTMGNSVETIGYGAFEFCERLMSIVIPSSVKEIDYLAFRNCNNLIEVVNKSALPIGRGSEQDGYVGYYAKHIIHDETQSNFIEQDGYLFYNDNGNYSLMDYTGTKTDLILPDTIENKAYQINKNAFYGNEKITSITIGDGIGIQTIEAEAFYECSNLSSVIIPNSVTSIGNEAFGECNSLTNIRLSDNIISISRNTFSGCDKLQYNVYDNGKYLGNENNPYLVLIGASSRDITSCSIHEETKIIVGAFYNCVSLTSIDIPDSVKVIDEESFYRCTGLTSVKIGNNVETLGWSAFESCTNLTSIDIPDSVTYIGGSAFSDCTNLISINIPDSVTYIGDSAFSDCDKLQYNVYDNGKYLGNENNLYLALIEPVNKDITTCAIHENTKIIISGTFMECERLTSVIISDSVTSIGGSAFFDCVKLEYIVIPDGVTTIERYTFFDCESLSCIVIPDSVTAIEEAAFSNCNNLGCVYYGGTKDDIYGIWIAGEDHHSLDNRCLFMATWYYYSETQPTDEGNYWYYDENGVPTKW